MKRISLAALAVSTLAVSSLASADSANLFSFFDTDKNGELSFQEYRNGGVDAEGQDWSKGLSNVCSEYVLKEVEPELTKGFAQLDTDNNKVISKAEFVKNGDKVYDEYWQASFKDADKNNDKLLSKPEYKTQAQNHLTTLEKAYADKEIPNQCKADVEYWKTYYQGLEQYIDPSFSYLDGNGDNKLSYDEYIGKNLTK